jgi:type IV pilus assembly protein PilW
MEMDPLTTKKNAAETMANGRSAGFTLVEMFIAMLVASIVILGVYTSYDIQQKAYTVQRELARMEANVKAAMYLIQKDLRNAGRGDQMTGSIGPNNLDIIGESRRYNAAFNGGAFPLANEDPNGFQGITINMGMDNDDDPNDGVANPMDVNNSPAAIQTIVYRVWDSNNDGRRELHRMVMNGAGVDITPGFNTMVADGIDAISFAFAYDMAPPPGGLAPQGELDRSNFGVGPIIWAVDDDATLGLDTNLDTNMSGSIGLIDGGGNDDADGDGWIRRADGNLGTQIPMKKIRAVRIWILARSMRAYPQYVNSAIYNVGHRVFQPQLEAGINAAYYGNDTPQFRFLVLDGAVHLRNRERLDVN